LVEFTSTLGEGTIITAGEIIFYPRLPLIAKENY
jgi:hypothetical protein